MGTLRLLLALSVVLFHSGPFWLTGTHFVGGVLAVESFFVISGFYMALVLGERYRGRLGAFYWNRFARLFPLYWAVWLLYFLAGEIEPSIDRFAALAASDPSPGTVALVLIANWLLIGSDWLLLLSSGSEGLYFTGNFLAEPVWLFKFHYVPQAWSLPIELAFYAIAPFLVHSPRRLLALAMASFAAKYATLAQLGPVDPWYYRFAPFELWLFCLGALAWHGMQRFDTGSLVRWRWPVLLAMVLAILGFEWLGDAPLHSITSPGYAAFLVALCIALPVLFRAFGDSRWDRQLGELSYPIYLSHLLVVGVVVHFGLRIGDDASGLIVIGSLLAGGVLAFWVARPLERALRRTARHDPGASRSAEEERR
ncbi:acyltransferase family protein [Pseudomarimonas salicorniae]|uniref:Acyltransferase n=1 Tax=Pseudomarimonas salicorniae TaxID=2933270 RepID=A0ABT0GGY2_9GAMM|nr:acyltransferase [Lysobacter sp. CAU 1642]MCK7593612.1 acyltransferase [Lysobacter sp. CAU 1642]